MAELPSLCAANCKYLSLQPINLTLTAKREPKRISNIDLH